MNTFTLSTGVIVLARSNGNPYRFVTEAKAARKAAELRASGIDATSYRSPALQQYYVQLVAHSGADLAGACEGEQIADLIDLVREVAEGRSGLVLIERAQKLLGEIRERAKEQR